MKSKRVDIKRIFVVRLERGEEIASSLKKFCEENKIKGGFIGGIGAVSYATLYSVKDSVGFALVKKKFSEPLELLSASGNISTANGEPLIHLHTVLGRSGKSTIGGHLLEAKISFTGEFFILETGRLEKTKQGELMLFKF